MGNCFALYTAKRKCWEARAAASGHAKVLQVVKTDGKILEYRRPMLVKDILMNFSGYGVGISDEASRHLPTNHELEIGHVYYLLPVLPSPVMPAVMSPVGSSPSSVNSESLSSVKRIKVIITKHQLEELLSEKISVQGMLSKLQQEAGDGVDSLTRWRPVLETIPEGSE